MHLLGHMAVKGVPLIYVVLLACAGLHLAAAAWNLQWSDEFNGTSVNPNKWVFETGAGGWGNNELQYYRKENAKVSGGYLNIEAKKESYGGAQYTSARLKTQGKFSTTYGKIEMRAKLPGGQGYWPSFWMLGDSITQVGWPACGEIDIMQYIGREPNHVYGSIHAPQLNEGFNGALGAHNGGGYTNGFKVYSIIWTASQIQFFADGQNYYTFSKAMSDGHWPFEGKRFFILLNLAIGGNWPGNPDGNTRFPQKFVIDYVRVYQQSN